MKGKLIVIEGTDCSGKATQSKKIVERLNDEGIRAVYMSFPMYNTPTGEIIAANILGKPDYGNCTFPEGAPNIPPKVAALYYAADRLYNIHKIEEMLEQGTTIVLDRYVESNMGHQGGKFTTEREKIEMLLWLEQLEFSLLELPRPDKVIFLYLPYEYGKQLREQRGEVLDGVESNAEYLINAEKTYSLMAERYNFDVVNCVKNDEVRTIPKINEDIYKIVNEFIVN